MERTPFNQLSAPQQEQPVVNETANPILYIDGFPIDLLRYFSVEPKSMNQEEKKRLGEISSWMPRDLSMGDFLLRIKNIEDRIGSRMQENRIYRIWHYMSLSNQINELEKKRGSLTIW